MKAMIRRQFVNCRLLAAAAVIAILAGTSACKPSQREVHVHAFIVTKGRQNIKLGLVTINSAEKKTVAQSVLNHEQQNLGLDEPLRRSLAKCQSRLKTLSEELRHVEEEADRLSKTTKTLDEDIRRLSSMRDQRGEIDLNEIRAMELRLRALLKQAILTAEGTGEGVRAQLLWLQYAAKTLSDRKFPFPPGFANQFGRGVDVAGESFSVDLNEIGLKDGARMLIECLRHPYAAFLGIKPDHFDGIRLKKDFLEKVDEIAVEMTNKVKEFDKTIVSLDQAVGDVKDLMSEAGDEPMAVTLADSPAVIEEMSEFYSDARWNRFVEVNALRQAIAAQKQRIDEKAVFGESLAIVEGKKKAIELSQAGVANRKEGIEAAIQTLKVTKTGLEKQVVDLWAPARLLAALPAPAVFTQTNADGVAILKLDTSSEWVVWAEASRTLASDEQERYAWLVEVPAAADASSPLFLSSMNVLTSGSAPELFRR